MENKEGIIKFENDKLMIDVKMDKETVWLSIDQMAELFQKNKSTISRHIKNIFDEEELFEKGTVANFATVQNEGNRSIKRNIEYYNLDVIISIGYRVKSKNGIIFRKWANKILKDYLIKGYAKNERRLKQLEKTINVIEIANRIDDKLLTKEAKNILKVINEYNRGLDLLDKYDYNEIKKVKKTVSEKQINYKEAMEIIDKLKFNEKSSLFALERNRGLEGIINNIYQTFNGKDLYEGIEEKASNLLYLIVKDHVFADGNKRIAACIFIYFLDFYDILKREGENVISNDTLVALTLLIAESKPKEKEIIVNLVMNFIAK